MIVGVCGCGYTGSGAYVDLLKEYEECNVFDDFELTIAYVPDGLKDLEYHLVIQPNRFMSSDVAIRRFIKFINGRSKGLHNDLQRGSNDQFKRLSIKYIKKLIQIEWNGYWNNDFFTGNIFKRNVEFRLFQNRIMRPLEKKRRIKTYPYRKMFFSVRPQNFYEITKAYIDALIKSFTGYDNNRHINVLNQPFPANCPETCFAFFNNPKAIVVQRDPRDLYIFCRHIMKSNAAWIPTDNVESFIMFYTKMRETLQDNPNTISLNFEDIIYHYDETIDKMESFLGLKKHISPRKHFDPQVSIVNTQLFKKYSQYGCEIKKIEKELSRYLYDFPEDYQICISGEAKDI